MRRNKTLIYIVIFVVLLVAAYFLTTDRGEKTASYDIDQTRIIDADSASIDKIEIKNDNDNITLVRSGGEWRLSEPVDGRANIQFVETALSNLGKIKLESIVSTNPEKHANYGFTSGNQATIIVYENGVDKGSFIIGNAGPGNQSYIRKIGDDNVYLVSNIIRSNLIKTSIDDWRDKTITKIPKESVNSVEFITAGDRFTAEKDPEGNFMINGENVSESFDGILNTLQNFNTQSFKDTTLAGDTSFDYTINVNWGPVTELKFLKVDTEPVQYLVQVSNDPQIYVLEEGLAKNVVKEKNDLIKK